jgi:hypothetical protein
MIRVAIGSRPAGRCDPPDVWPKGLTALWAATLAAAIGVMPEASRDPNRDRVETSPRPSGFYAKVRFATAETTIP